MHASRFLLGALALSMLVAGFGCKVAPGKVPTTSPIVTFTAPEREDVFPEEDTDTDGEASDDSDADDGN